LFYKQHQLMNM